jgi:hypothetical protein
VEELRCNGCVYITLVNARHDGACWLQEVKQQKSPPVVRVILVNWNNRVALHVDHGRGMVHHNHPAVNRCSGQPLVILAAVCDGVYCGSVDVDNVLAVVDKSVYFQGVGCKHTSLERVTKVNAPRAFRGVRVAFDARVCGSVALVRVILGRNVTIRIRGA